MSGIVNLQLVLVRSLFDEAQATAVRGDDLACMSAILLLDIAVETAVKATLRELHIDPPKSDRLDAFIDAFPDGISKTREAASVKRLRKARNPVQHDGLAPSLSNVEAFIIDANAFISLVAQEVFHEDFGQVSVVMLLRDGPIKDLLESASAKRNDGELGRALVLAGAAYEALFYVWARAVLAADGHDGQRDWALPRQRLPLLESVGYDPLLPKLDDFDYPRLVRMTLGFSINELLSVQSLITIATEAVKDTSIRQQISVEDVDLLIGMVARQSWRLESENPGLFDELPLIDLADHSESE